MGGQVVDMNLISVILRETREDGAARVLRVGRRHQHVVVMLDAAVDHVVDADGTCVERGRGEDPRDQDGKAFPADCHGGASPSAGAVSRCC